MHSGLRVLSSKVSGFSCPRQTSEGLMSPVGKLERHSIHIFIQQAAMWSIVYSYQLPISRRN